MKTQPLISCIIPVYNLEPYLERCVESLRLQSYPKLELIFTNDGSTDNSLCLLQKQADQDSRIRILTQENRGAALARKVGIEHATGDYICFVDGDDYLPTNAIELLVEALGPEPTDLVCGGYERICKTYTAPVFEQPKPVFEGIEFLEAIVSHRITVTLWGKLFRRTLFAGLPSFAGIRLGEDSLVNMYIGLQLPRVKFVHQVVYSYFQRSESANHTKLDLEFLVHFEEVVQNLLETKPKLLRKYPYLPLLSKIRWLYTYLKHSRSPWIGSNYFVTNVCREIVLRHEQIQGKVIPLDLRLIRLYQYRVCKPLVSLFTTARRIRQSIIRRQAKHTTR